MGKIKYLNEVRDFLKATPIIRNKDVQVITGNRNYSSLLLHNLVKKGEVKRISKGYYSSREDPMVTVLCFKPAYIGLQGALSFHNLWEQETNVVIVTAKKVRTGVRKVFGNNVVLHRIDHKYFFGFDYLKYDNFFIPISDTEKTLIDLVYFNEIPDKQVIKEISKHVDKKKLKKYLDVYSGKFKKRIGRLIKL